MPTSTPTHDLEARTWHVRGLAATHIGPNNEAVFANATNRRMLCGLVGDLRYVPGPHPVPMWLGDVCVTCLRRWLQGE